MSTTMTLGYDIKGPKCGMEEAAEDIREGRVYKMTSNEDLFGKPSNDIL